MVPDEQGRDLLRFLKMLDVEPPNFDRKDWLETLAPPDAKPEEVQLFVHDLAKMHQLVSPRTAAEATVLSIDQRPIQPPSTVSTVPLT